MPIAPAEQAPLPRKTSFGVQGPPAPGGGPGGGASRRVQGGALAFLLLTAAAPAVTVAPAVRGEIAESVTVTGTLVPREEVVVSPQVEGLAVTAVLAEEGDAVARGQVLARLARETLDASMAQAAAQVARAEAAIAGAGAAVAEAQATRVQADAALLRARELLGTGTGSRETFEQRQAAAGVAAARLLAAQGQLRSAEADRALALAQQQELAVRLARTEVRAPVGGVVSRRAARVGAVVTGAGDPLFRVIEDGVVELEGDVPEALLARLRPGEPASVEVPGRDGRIAGRVRLVSPEVSRASRLGRVRISVDASGLAIGGFARAGVEVARREGVLVPLAAVLIGPEGARVQVVRDGVVDTRAVAVGLRAGGRAELLDGLAAGEQVVAVAGTFVRAGDRVTPVAER